MIHMMEHVKKKLKAKAVFLFGNIGNILAKTAAVVFLFDCFGDFADANPTQWVDKLFQHAVSPRTALQCSRCLVF